MRYLLSLASFLAIRAVGAARTGVKYGDWRDYTWSYYPEYTADELKELGLPLPEVAAPITCVVEQENYIVKLECIDCPFRVREYREVFEYWQEDPQDNSLLFNISISENKRALLVNGRHFEPLALPASISAFQVPANLSAETMGKMVDMQMMDSSWKVGTKYGDFEISYEHTIMMTEERHVQLLQFVVTHAEKRERNPGSAVLDKPKQKLIQMKLSREHMNAGLKIKSIELVEQGEKITHARMPCGKEAPRFTQVYRVTEWDYYGHIGTWSRTWHKMTSDGADWLFDHMPHFMIVALILSVVVIRRRIIRARAAMKAIEDPEAVRFIVEDDEEGTPEPTQDEPHAELEAEKLVDEEKMSDKATLTEEEIISDEEKKAEEPESIVSEESKPSLLD